MRSTAIALFAIASAACSSTASEGAPVDGTSNDASSDVASTETQQDSAPAMDTSLPPFDTASCAEAGSAREPAHHRASQITCSRMGLSTTPCGDASSCLSLLWYTCNGGVCDYDQCLSDSDCGATGVCSCKGETREFGAQSYGNVCVPSDCRVDADCCPGQWCSPSDDHGTFYGVRSYHCHTASDECIDDADCADDGAVRVCAFDPVTGHWACRDGGGAG